MLINEYLTIWVNIKPTRLLNGSRFLNLNTTCLLNELIVSTHLSDFIEMKQKYTNFSTKLWKTKNMIFYIYKIQN